MVKSLQCGRPGFDPWVGKIPWRREWQLTPVFLPEKLHGQKSLVSYSPRGCKESDMTELLTHTYRGPLGSPGGTSGKEPHPRPLRQCRRHKIHRFDPWVWSLKDPLEKGMATHSIVLERRIPWTEGPDRLQLIGLRRV